MIFATICTALAFIVAGGVMLAVRPGLNETAVFYPLVAGLAVLLAMASVQLVDATEWAKRFALAVWTVGPPLFFGFEWVFIKKQGRGMGKDDFAKFKHSQELASKIWVAVATVVFAMLYGDKFFKP